MSRPFEILVAGAGIAGLAVALLLAGGRCGRRSGSRLRVRVVDGGRVPSFDPAAPIDLRVSAISAGSQALLASLGAWPGNGDARWCPFDHMRVWDAASEPDGMATLRFDADEFALPHLGYIVENRLLLSSLFDALTAHGVETLFDADITGLDFASGRPVVTVASATEIAADLVIAADGSDSSLRALAGMPVWEYPYRQSAFVTHCHPAIPHGNTAWQRFLPDGPLGLLPLADGRVSVVWTSTPEHAAGLLDLDDAALGEVLADATDGVLGDIRAGGPRAAFPLLARHARQYVRQGLALLGDAAHAVHPLAGQGANLGIADAAELARVVEDALLRRENPADRPVLRRYERARKGHNAAMLHFMTGLNRLFASDSVFLGELRRTGMALFNHSGPVRTTMAGIALGSAVRAMSE